MPFGRNLGECDPSPASAHTIAQDLERLDQVAATFNQDLPILCAPGLVRMPLLDGYELAFSPLYGNHILVLDQAGQEVLNHFTEPRPLASASEIGMDAEDCYEIAVRLAAHGLLTHINARTLQPSNPDTLSVWLHITNACNLACGYCYVVKNTEAMDEATGLQAIDTIFASAQQYSYSRILLKYAGGEPTRNFALVQRLHGYADASAKADGVTLKEVVLSNGVALATTMLTYLRDAEIQLTISLDGPSAVQDRQRPGVNGRGSFASVVQSIERAIAIGIKPHLAVVVTARSAQYLAETVRFALDHDLGFSLSFERDHSHAAGDSAASHAAITAGMQSAFETIAGNMPLRRLIDNLVDRARFDGVSGQVCGAAESLLVIDHHGRIARCQTDLAHPVSHISAQDPLNSIRLEPTGFQRIAASGKEGCRTCVWRNWCAGGCPAFTYKMTGRNDVQSPYCNVYKQLYPAAIRLEGLRLLKWASTGTQIGMELWL